VQVSTWRSGTDPRGSYPRGVALRIRPAAPEDASFVLALWHYAHAERTHTDDVVSIARLVAHDPDALILAVDDERRVVGSVIAGWDGWRGSIYRLVVAPDHRRKGLGRRLLGAAEDRFRNLEAARLQAIVVETDTRATAFWRSTGWGQQVERLRFVKG